MVRRTRLICFDVDGTLVHHPRDKVIWQLLHDRFLGSDALNERRREDYLAGRIRYERWVELDVRDWQDHGVTRSDILGVIRELELVPGARETVHALKRRGYLLGVISGTIDLVLDSLFPDHPFDDVFTNRVLFDDAGGIVGWRATPFDMEGKAEALRQIAAREGVPLAECAFVGDHDNDVAVARAAGFAVAFRPKSEALVAACDAVLPGPSLEPLLAMFP